MTGLVYVSLPLELHHLLIKLLHLIGVLVLLDLVPQLQLLVEGALVQHLHLLFDLVARNPLDHFFWGRQRVRVVGLRQVGMDGFSSDAVQFLVLKLAVPVGIEIVLEVLFDSLLPRDGLLYAREQKFLLELVARVFDYVRKLVDQVIHLSLVLFPRAPKDIVGGLAKLSFTAKCLGHLSFRRPENRILLID